MDGSAGGAARPTGPPGTTSDSPEMRSSLRVLNWVNFFLADVQAGLGPFLGVYLINKPGWNPATIGLMLTLGGAVGLFLGTPVGALIDATRHKRSLLAGAAALTSIGTLVVTVAPSIAVVTAAQLATGLAGVVLGPVIAAMALGMVGPKRYPEQTGRMGAFNHAGNVVGSAVAGLAGYLVSLQMGFWIAGAFGLVVVGLTLMIKPKLIDHDLARGLTPRDDGRDQPSGVTLLLRNRPLLVLAVVVGLWQLANGAMLNITGQKLAEGHAGTGALFQAGLVIVAQLVMIPMSLLAGRRADRWGRKPLMLAAFLVLPVRGVLFTLSAAPGWAIAVQALDGIGAGLQAPLFAIMVADLTRGTGRYNIAMGAASTVQAVGAVLSPTLGGAIMATAGYNWAMVVLTVIAVLGLAALSLAVPETGDPADRRRSEPPTGSPPASESPPGPRPAPTTA